MVPARGTMREPDNAAQPLRVGVCGNGYWARTVHLPALAAMSGVKLVGVWGRTLEASTVTATPFAIPAFADFDALLDAVDAVTFAVSPGAQAALALRAANAGKHLLLEKPAATTLADADRLVEAVERKQLSAVSFMTRMFVDEATDFAVRARAGHHTRGEGSWISRALLPGSPFTNSVWRQGDDATLWDLGPHVLSMLVQVLGPVIQVEARRARKAKFECRMLHATGAQSTLIVDQMDETLTRGGLERYVFSGGNGVIQGGPFKADAVQCFRSAFRLLIDGIGLPGGPPGPNIRFSRDIVAVLEAARISIEAGGMTVGVQL